MPADELIPAASNDAGYNYLDESHYYGLPSFLCLRDATMRGSSLPTVYAGCTVQPDSTCRAGDEEDHDREERLRRRTERRARKAAEAYVATVL